MGPVVFFCFVFCSCRMLMVCTRSLGPRRSPSFTGASSLSGVSRATTRSPGKSFRRGWPRETLSGCNHRLPSVVFPFSTILPFILTARWSMRMTRICRGLTAMRRGSHRPLLPCTRALKTRSGRMVTRSSGTKTTRLSRSPAASVTLSLSWSRAVTSPHLLFITRFQNAAGCSSPRWSSLGKMCRRKWWTTP